MTKKDKVKNMFRDANGWKTGIRNGLTFAQIVYKLGLHPQTPFELWEEKNRTRSILLLVQEDLKKEGVLLFFLPFGKKQTRIVFIPEAREEKQRCLDVIDRRERRRKYNVQCYRDFMRRDLANHPEWSEKDKKMIQTMIDRSYELMD